MTTEIDIPTPIGSFRLIWTPQGLARVRLPDATSGNPRGSASSLRAPPLPSGMPDFVCEAVSRIAAYGAGARIVFRDIPLDPGEIDPFDRAIFAAALNLDFGEVTTYGALAASAGFPGKARETGAALGRNRLPLVVPCHRILAAGGGLGGFSAPGGVATKRMLLAHEGATVSPPGQASFAF